jgi:predicted acetyltransferase
MTSTIKKLANDEIKAYVDIVVNAYPGIMQNTSEFKERFFNNLLDLQENEEAIEFFGLFRNNILIGGMRFHYFTMNLFGKSISVGGLGLVAVDLLHKKEKAAKEMVEFFIHYFKEKGASLVMLYPFRPDFYRNMGFGYGVKMNQYTIEPSSFPNTATKEGLVFLDESYKSQVRDCYHRKVSKTHGMVYKTNNELNALFKNPNNKIVGYLNGGQLEGYLSFTFKNEGSFLQNNLVIQEFIYENPNALAKLNTFIHTQADQIQRVILNSQDPHLAFMFKDPRNHSNHLIPSVYHETNTSGVGLMYRIINSGEFLKEVIHEKDITVPFKLTIKDTFLSEVPITHFIPSEDYQFEVEVDVADLSSLLMGAIDVNHLYQYGLLNVNNPHYLHVVEKALNKGIEPICTTAF